MNAIDNNSNMDIYTYDAKSTMLDATLNVFYFVIDVIHSIVTI